MDFTVCKFKDLIDYKSGYTWSKEQESTKCLDGSVRVLTVTNIQEKLDLSSKLYLLKVSQKDRERKAVSEGWSIAVSSNGNRKRIGNAVFVEGNTDYLFASFLIAFRPRDFHVLLPKYFFYWFSSQLIQERISSVAEGTTGLGNLDIRFLRNMDIDYPKRISEQQAIVDILSKIDEAIKATENSILAAERLKKSLMQNFLTGLLKPDGSQRNEHEMCMTKYGYAPKAWKYCQIKDLIKEGYIEGIQDGNHGESHPVSAEFVDEGIPFVMASNISKGFVDVASCKKLTKKRADTLRIGFAKDGDVLLSHKASIGYTCIVEGTNPYFMLTPQVTYYRVVRDKLLPEYLKLFFEKYNFQCVIEGLAKQSTRNFIGITNQKKMWIYLPDDINEQYEIISPILKVDNQIYEKNNKVEALKKLKKSLMQNLLTGKVQVDVDKINKLLDKA